MNNKVLDKLKSLAAANQNTTNTWQQYLTTVTTRITNKKKLINHIENIAHLCWYMQSIVEVWHHSCADPQKTWILEPTGVQIVKNLPSYHRVYNTTLHGFYQKVNISNN